MPNFFNKYPYTDFHELNLDWILSQIKLRRRRQRIRPLKGWQKNSCKDQRW